MLPLGADGRAAMALSTNDRLQVAGIVVATIGIIVAFLVAVIPQEVGCWTHLASCGAGTSANAQAIAPANVTQVVPGKIDKTMPYHVPEPRAHVVGVGREPVIGVDVSSIINRGKPVLLNLSGDGFFAYSSVRITWFTPQGSVYQRIIVPTDDRGLMQVALLWIPAPRLGLAGNEGMWKVAAVDQISGHEADAQVNVKNDAGTPPVSDWSADSVPKAAGPPTVSAGTSGYLCAGNGAWSEVNLQGFRPEASIDLAFYGASGRRVLLVHGLRADPAGQVSNILSFWKVQGCDSRESFDYTVVAEAPSTGQHAQADISLTTRQ